MPIYEFQCKDCGKISEIVCSISGYNKTIMCSHCGSRNVEKIFSVPARVQVEEKGAAGSKESECCGDTNPCDNPKRCCNK